jgi:hypothetical protein
MRSVLYEECPRYLAGPSQKGSTILAKTMCYRRTTIPFHLVTLSQRFAFTRQGQQVVVGFGAGSGFLVMPARSIRRWQGGQSRRRLTLKDLARIRGGAPDCSNRTAAVVTVSRKDAFRNLADGSALPHQPVARRQLVLMLDTSTII